MREIHDEVFYQFKLGNKKDAYNLIVSNNLDVFYLKGMAEDWSIELALELMAHVANNAIEAAK